jgi:hypothetical protein
VATGSGLRHTQLMRDQPAARRASRLRSRWGIFVALSTVTLGICFFRALATGGSTSAGLVFLGGLIVVGLAAAFMQSAIWGLAESGPNMVRANYGSHSMGGGFDGGGSGGGDCGGGGAGC